MHVPGVIVRVRNLGPYHFYHTGAGLNQPPRQQAALAKCIATILVPHLLSFLAQIGYERSHPVVSRGIDYLKADQEKDGSWFGRWGTNYIYGTWSVLNALNAAGEDMKQPYIRKAIDWTPRITIDETLDSVIEHCRSGELAAV